MEISRYNREKPRLIYFGRLFHQESGAKAINIQDDNPATFERVPSFLQLQDKNEDAHTDQYQPVFRALIVDHDTGESALLQKLVPGVTYIFLKNTIHYVPRY